MTGSNLIRYGFNAAKLFRLTQQQSQFIAVRSCGWVRDFKPGPYPRTPEEREAAARKYNLIPEDYDCYEEGSGFGDYPKLPAVSHEVMDPYENYDYYYRRRNFGETLHRDYDILMSERTNPNVVHRYPPRTMFAIFLSPFIIIAIIQWIDYYFDLHTANPMKPKQLPGDGRVHYTFEPLD
ncbi:NADH:ubiquinone oxidoreductase subunit ASHI [Dermatophagoides pteronyssinus]|uniref:NADH dehydrogenase [ubiquinone] 1 beta subcomplex subunit 8, mitochondrial-like n=1 Tax=Dermatophagoides pteronyssinus TaxID=6956 RepID=A0A6P6YKV6_DERPT|nr:NADH dehydrogenase [ubiquinone] 1 beta subcomplex subunit 8, mitochondrial-like [Dermatophagoides pteronyssinus]